MPQPPVDPKHVLQVRVENGQVSVNKDSLRMGRDKDKVLRWEIVTRGWRFPDFEDGIVIEANTDRQFSNGHRDSNDDRHYVLHNKNSNSASYKYTIHVTDGTSKLLLDPIIINES
jgi:hypothetical protein